MERVGYLRGSLYLYEIANKEESPCCALGAIKAAAGLANSSDDSVWDIDASHCFARYLRKFPGQKSIEVAHWNDHRSRTQEEVVAALRAAAETCTCPEGEVAK